ncbi:MAG: hypothetical protein HS126_15065 [Anaerolineales bacterium]|nr:hypothetical protein [Anaerolineales bacterium]
MSEQGQLIAWAVLSLALPVGWAWRQSRLAKAGTEPGLAEQWLNSAARFFYEVGLPYLALISGAVAPRFLGLKGLENLAALPWGGDVATWFIDLQKAAALILVECLADGGVVIKAGLAALLLLAGIRLGLARLSLKLPVSTPSMGEIVFEGLHWAFYRAMFWTMTGDLYLGVVWGTVWALLEWTLMAWVQPDGPLQKPQLLMKAMILIVTSTLFFYVPNLWLLWPMQGMMIVLLALPHRADPEFRKQVSV